MARRLATRSARVSPMPSRMPVVNGMRSSPACAHHLAGAAPDPCRARCGGPRPCSRRRGLMFSSIRPMLTLSGLSAAISSRVIRPALVCGSSPSSSAISQACAHVVDGARVPEHGEVARYDAERQLRLVAEAHQRLDAAARAPVARAGADLLGQHRPRVRVVRVAAEGAVRAAVATEVGDRQEDLGRVGDDGALVPRADVPGDGEDGAELLSGVSTSRRVSASASLIGAPSRARSSGRRTAARTPCNRLAATSASVVDSMRRLLSQPLRCA